MYPFNINNPYAMFGFPPVGFLPFFPIGRRRVPYPLLDRRGMPEVCTTGLIENLEGESTADYGINPCVWRALPNQATILWKVRHPVSQNGASLPVAIVIPTANNSSTVVSNGANGGTTKIPVIDNKSTQVVGSDVTVPTGSGTETQQGYTTEHIVYIDKCNGTFRLLGVKAASSPAQASGGNTTAESSASKSK